MVVASDHGSSEVLALDFLRNQNPEPRTQPTRNVRTPRVEADWGVGIVNAKCIHAKMRHVPIYLPISYSTEYVYSQRISND